MASVIMYNYWKHYSTFENIIKDVYVYTCNCLIVLYGELFSAWCVGRINVIIYTMYDSEDEVTDYGLYQAAYGD